MTMGCTVGKYPAALVLYFLCMGLWYPSLAGATVTISNITIEKGDVGETVNISCVVVQVNVTVEWSFQDKQLKGNDRINITTQETKHGKDKDGEDIKSTISTLSILNVTANDSGNYTCKATLGETSASKTKPLNMSFPVKLVNVTQSPIRENLTDHRNLDMECVFEVYKPGVVRWLKKRNELEDEDVLLYEDTEPSVIWPKKILSKFAPRVNNTDDSGLYICEAIDKEIDSKDSGEIEVQVITIPRLKIEKAIPINATQVYLNWSVNAFFSPVKSYSLIKDLVHMNEVHIHPDNTSAVIKDLAKNTTYNFMLEVVTEYGRSQHTQQAAVNVTTLDKEPVFRPNISINGFSATSVTIGWAPPPEDIEKLIHYYELTARKKGDTNTFKTCQTRDSRNLPYMFDNLLPHSTYVFQVQACSDYTKTCGPPSEEMEAATLDGVPGKPDDVNATCGLDYMTLTWKVPKNPNAEIKGYTVEITGNATYKDRYGIEKLATWGPLSKFTTNDSTSIRIIELTPNTHYTARVSAMTRTRRRGEEDIGSCTTQATLPDAPPRPRWRKINENGTFMFRMYLPRISERNGPICCYRVYMVRIPQNMNFKSLPSSPRDINVGDWEEAHKSSSLISYIADVFSNNNFPSDSELVLGDGNVLFNKSDPIFNQEKCRRCLKRPKRHVKPTPVMITTSSSTTPAEELMMVGSDDDDDDDVTTEDPEELLPPKRRRRSYVDGDFSKDSMMKDSADDFVLVNDGGLDSGSNYTLFVELIGADSEEARYSDYTSVLKPAASPPVVVPSTAIEIALQITCSVAGLILVLMVAFCVLQSRRSRKMPPHAHIELHNPITAARRYWDSIRGHRQLEPQIPPDIPPIPKEGLIQAYTQRQMDSDYGFQKEFELLQMVPEFLTDRTTHASEARENQPKNRYPDIKAYDQTRVKLSQIDSITGSDYINANYVMGYQERKQYICAQGPTDTTVNDFWRMIWEHGLEIIVMLTNLEEYSKVKCSKYWPEERGARAFGNITVQHVGEKRYSDYIVRELKISKQPLNADGQPIVENNGIAKRNGDVKDGSESSAPTSPREVKESGDVRVVRQFHFLMWKDFGAPEHPYSILRFIKRVNEAWAHMVGRAVVVHCSAGVGRTGTLVALDSLLQQLRAKGHVSVFNSVAELRTQRNFLVQSLKQYVFVYRALVEYAHYGDTEISASRLKPAVDRLRNTPEGNDKCLMEYEFEKMLTSPVQEPVKSMGAGAGEELRTRNRSIEFLPYDRNRVILAPISGRDYSTYINASFIEAYDNSESFIITQDPLPNTIPDFWRMVSEHNVTTIVMLSELGEGKCPRYWDDGLVEYENILVQYEESESCPYYTRRTFRVTHEKSGEVSYVRQLQYQGWPTARGHVPEVTRGLAELADAAGAHGGDHGGTMLVHCQFGTERSPLFVALCSLIRQLRVERRVDVSAVARAVRSQRARTIDTFLQYEFLYRAILNYAELHNLLEDS